jgi:hypothetical protein
VVSAIPHGIPNPTSRTSSARAVTQPKLSGRTRLHHPAAAVPLVREHQCSKNLDSAPGDRALLVRNQGSGARSMESEIDAIDPLHRRNDGGRLPR